MIALILMNHMSTQRRTIRKQKVVKSVEIEKKVKVEYCRTCLCTDDLVALFYGKETESKRSEDLLLTTGLEIKMNDGLSQKICTQCLEKINMALQFRRTSKKAEKALLGMLTGIKPKQKLSKQHKAVKTKKVAKREAETDFDLAEELNYDYNLFGDDLQNDYECDEQEDSKPNVKQEGTAAGQGKKKRVVIPNALSYKCSTCNKEFRMKATYKAHMRFHTNYCVCEACGKRCRNNNQLQEHKRARHGLGKIHKCAYCEYSSATKEALTIHERRHTGERPYICDHCGTTFHRRSNLVQHIAIHLPDKNFQCSICPKREKSRKLLLIHEYKYHRENRYRYLCPICQDSFTRPGNVRQHLVRSHGVAREDQGIIDKFEVHPQMLPDDAQVIQTLQ